MKDATALRIIKTIVDVQLAEHADAQAKLPKKERCRDFHNRVLRDLKKALDKNWITQQI